MTCSRTYPSEPRMYPIEAPGRLRARGRDGCHRRDRRAHRRRSSRRREPHRRNSLVDQRAFGRAGHAAHQSWTKQLNLDGNGVTLNPDTLQITGGSYAVRRNAPRRLHLRCRRRIRRSAGTPASHHKSTRSIGWHTRNSTSWVRSPCADRSKCRAAGSRRPDEVPAAGPLPESVRRPGGVPGVARR